MGDIGYTDRMLGSKWKFRWNGWSLPGGAVRIQFERHDRGDSHLPRNSQEVSV